MSQPFPMPRVVQSSQYSPHGLSSSPVAMTARTNSSPSAPAQDFWLLDSGATHHMTADLSNLNMAAPYPSSETVTGASGEGLNIAHIGNSNLPTPHYNFRLNSVLHVPRLSQSLLSMHQLCKDNHCRCIIDELSISIQDKVTEKTLFHGLSNNAVYPIPIFPSTTVSPAAFLGQKVSSTLWHCRLGHPTNSVVQVALGKASIPFSDTSSPHTCTSCLKGKFTKLPFSVNASKSVTPFEVIHSDVWGPAPSVSLDGYKYYVSFIDECTRYTWIFPLINKAAVFDNFVAFHAFVSTSFGANIKVFQSDGGGEYLSTKFQSFLRSNGIIHQMSCPYTPEQNGLAERKNRHIVETSITLLQQASLSSQFWYHAFATATYLINRMPTSTLGMKSPFEALYHTPPRLDHLKVFGCLCYPSMKPYRPNKLAPKTMECIFLGYASVYKGYICYDESNHRFIVSRHVLFDETCFSSLRLPTNTLSKSPDFKSLQSSSSVVYPNTFNHPPVIPIPLPHVFVPPVDTATPSITQSSPTNNGDLVPGSSLAPSGSTPAATRSSELNAAITGSNVDLTELYPDITASQAPVLQSVNLPTVNSHPMQTRSKSGVVKKKQAFHTELLADLDTEPTSFTAASKSDHWIKAMHEEMDALIQQHTWSLVPLPPNKNLVGCKWIYKIKRNPDGTIARHKARLVAKGFSQEAGLDYHETFSPVVKPTTVRVILSLAATKGWKLNQLDVKNAFLHGFLGEEVYMAQPQGFVNKAHPAYVCKLEKSLYGLKQAPRAWNDMFTTFLLSLGFKSSFADPSLYVKHDGQSIIILLLYVDDIILTGDNDSCLQVVISQLTREFDMKDLGPLHYFLGLQIDYESRGMFVHQTKYVRDLLTKTNMLHCKPCVTPCHPNQKLLNHGSPSFSDPTLYRSIVGALQYLTFTRPDIAYSVNQVCQFMHSPLESHFLAVKRILRYLRGTSGWGVCFRPGSLDITAYTDTDWAGDLNDRRSTTGFVLFLGSNPVSWSSKKQHTVSRSSTEAEYCAMATTTAEIVWLQQLLKDLQITSSFPPLLHCDNISAMALATNPVMHSKAKHIEVDCHFVRERVQQRIISLQFVASADQYADIFTKGLCSPSFLHHCSNLMLGDSQHKIEGEC